jgi:hypothetical protein
MKNITLSLFVLLSTLNAFSQKNSFGILLGTNAYDVQISNVGNSGTYSKFNVGGFFEHQINNQFGAKSYLLYSSTNNGDYDFYGSSGGNNQRITNIMSQTIQLHLLAKYSLNKEYKKGFYALSGLRVTNLLKSKSDQNDNLDDTFFKKTNYGLLLGFGLNFAKHYSIELVGDRNISNPLRSDNFKGRNLGAYFNFVIDIESIINNNS